MRLDRDIASANKKGKKKKTERLGVRPASVTLSLTHSVTYVRYPRLTVPLHLGHLT